ncbi:hypothetical protein Bbelb_017380 [Branchiostoma belcheri]|nr:hypothetical protein Bbelb_017380 [Branchiostoma belcheri]
MIYGALFTPDVREKPFENAFPGRETRRRRGEKGPSRRPTARMTGPRTEQRGRARRLIVCTEWAGNLPLRGRRDCALGSDGEKADPGRQVEMSGDGALSH